MKRPILLIVAGLISCLNLRSQDQFMRDAAGNGHGSGTEQFRIGYGFQSVPIIREAKGSGISNQGEGSLSPQSISVTATGPISFSYIKDVYSRFTWGVDLVYLRLKTQYTYSDNSGNSWQSNYLSVLSRGDYRYVNQDNFQLYSGIAVGLSYGIATNSQSNTKTKSDFAYQATLLGFRAGNYFALFGEIGYGYRGIAQGGLSIRF